MGQAHRGNHADAERFAREAVEYTLRTDSPWTQGDALCDLATVLEASGRIEDALAALRKALALYEQKEIVPAGPPHPRTTRRAPSSDGLTDKPTRGSVQRIFRSEVGRWQRRGNTRRRATTSQVASNIQSHRGTTRRRRAGTHRATRATSWSSWSPTRSASHLEEQRRQQLDHALALAAASSDQPSCTGRGSVTGDHRVTTGPVPLAALATECGAWPRHDGPSEEWAHLGSNPERSPAPVRRDRASLSHPWPVNATS